MGIIPEPFSDFVNTSSPAEFADELRAAVLDAVGELGGYQSTPELLRFDLPGCQGTIKFGRRHAVATCSVSGSVLSLARSARRLGDLLAAMASVPHRVTVLHATVDVAEHSRPVLRRLYRQGCAEQVAFSRKAIPKRQVTSFRRASHYDDGHTGTLYLGNRKRDIWAKVYDKRNEILDRHVELHGALSADVRALVDPGPLTRYELALGRHVGVTLADVAAPSAVFWHFAGGVLLPRPIASPAWSPAAEGYVLPPRQDVLPSVQMALLLERSPDVSRLLSLARRCGPEGFSLLLHRLRQMREVPPSIGSPSAAAVSPTPALAQVT